MKTLAAWRAHRGLTQQQLADAVGTTKGEISRLEAGKRRMTLQWLQRIAAVYQVPSTALMGPPHSLTPPPRPPAEPEAANDNVLVVSDDGMAPTLEAGDEVELDLDDRDARTPGLFAIREGSRTTVRRVQKAGERLVVAFDNPSYRPYEVRPDDITVVGRAVRRAHRL